MTRRSRTAALLAPALLLLSGCGGEASDASPAARTAPPAAEAGATPAQTPPAAPAEPVGPVSELPANELGEIMVLEYHRTGDNEGEFVRSLAHFREDLRSLYERGYRPVTMRQVLDGDIDIPAGTTPVVFTFDDATRGQFYHLPDGSIDPNTMLGSWAAFRKENPAWKNGAVWCVLPAAEHPSNFFSEKKDREFASRAERETNIRNKVTYLVENGHEVCNHTLYHARLDRARDDAQAQEWIGRGEDSVQVYLPEGYDIVTFALPLGQWPKNRPLAWKGSWKGKPYEYRAVLEVSGGPNPSPFSTEFDPHSVDRFIVAPNHLERQLDAYEKNPARRYVSDGDPSTVAFPAREADQLDRARLHGKRPVTLPAAAG